MAVIGGGKNKGQAAATGAAMGTAAGSVVPGLGTAVGALFGAAIGVAGAEIEPTIMEKSLAGDLAPSDLL